MAELASVLSLGMFLIVLAARPVFYDAHAVLGCARMAATVVAITHIPITSVSVLSPKHRYMVKLEASGEMIELSESSASAHRVGSAVTLDRLRPENEAVSYRFTDPPAEACL